MDARSAFVGIDRYCCFMTSGELLRSKSHQAWVVSKVRSGLAPKSIFLVQGVIPAEPGKPLPRIAINDVRIIAWMAVKAGK